MTKTFVKVHFELKEGYVTFDLDAKATNVAEKIEAVCKEILENLKK